MVNICIFGKKEGKMTVCTLLIFIFLNFYSVPVLDSLANFFH